MSKVKVVNRDSPKCVIVIRIIGTYLVFFSSDLFIGLSILFCRRDGRFHFILLFPFSLSLLAEDGGKEGSVGKQRNATLFYAFLSSFL